MHYLLIEKLILTGDIGIKQFKKLIISPRLMIYIFRCLTIFSQQTKIKNASISNNINIDIALFF